MHCDVQKTLKNSKIHANESFHQEFLEWRALPIESGTMVSITIVVAKLETSIKARGRRRREVIHNDV